MKDSDGRRAVRLPPEVRGGVARVHLGKDVWMQIDAADVARVTAYPWGYNAGRREVSRNDGGHTVIFARWLTGAPVGVLVDHVNGDRLDHRRENLRLASCQENACNSRRKRGSSRYKGVHWHARRQKWNAMIRGGESRHLGLFTTEEEAALAYDAAARLLHGAFACLNFPRAGERAALAIPVPEGDPS